MRELRVGAHAAVIGLVAFGAAACHDDHDHNGHGEFHIVEVIDRGQTARPVVTSWTAGQGWTGQLPEISLSSSNARISLGFNVFEEDGDEVVLDDAPFSMRFALALNAPTGIIATEADRGDLFHIDHVHVYGLAEGTTRIQFVLWDIDHADDATDSIEIRVVP